MNCPRPECRGIDHLGLCHQCPHDGDKALASLPWAETPCASCKAGDSREQGHGRGYSYESVPPGLVADETDAPRLFTEEEAPTPFQQVRVVLHALAQLMPQEYVALIEYVRPDPRTGKPRDLACVANAVGAIFHEKQVSLQMIDMRVEAARKKLARGARFACAALKMPGAIPHGVKVQKRASGACRGGKG